LIINFIVLFLILTFVYIKNLNYKIK